MLTNTQSVIEAHAAARQALAEHGINDASKSLAELINELACRHKALKGALDQICWANVIADQSLAVNKCIEIAYDALSKDHGWK